MRNILFQISFYLITIIVFILSLLLLLLPRRVMRFWFIKLYGHIVLFICKYIGHINYKLHRLNKEASIITSKHSSNWEIAYLALACERPVFVVKEQLMNIPVFGMFLRISGAIALKRDGSLSDIKKLIKQVKLSLDEGNQVIIFPQGTRQDNNEPADIKDGIWFLYKNLNKNYPVTPVYHDAGNYWHRDNGIIASGEVEVIVHKNIKSGLQKEIFMNKVKNYFDNKDTGENI